MKYYLVNENEVIKIYFKEPKDKKIRCYGFNNFLSIPTKFS